jgi:hypothetical protein
MLVKSSRYRHNERFWMISGEGDERLAGRKTPTVTEPEPDKYELYDVTADPPEQGNLAHTTYATDTSHRAPTRCSASSSNSSTHSDCTQQRRGFAGRPLVTA